MNDTVFEVVDSFKDLGVLITGDLTWDLHINSVVSKRSKMLGMVKRSVGYSAPPSV